MCLHTTRSARTIHRNLLRPEKKTIVDVKKLCLTSEGKTENLNITFNISVNTS